MSTDTFTHFMYMQNPGEKPNMGYILVNIFKKIVKFLLY